MIESVIRELLDHLWQSSLCAICIWLLTLNLARNRAGLRYRLWLIASLKFLMPFALIAAAGTLVGENQLFAAAGAHLAHIQPLVQPFSDVTPMIGPASAPGGDLLPILAGLWLAGFGVMISRCVSQWVRVREIVRNTSQLSATELLEVRSSGSALEPGLIGIIRPVITLPDDIAEHLTAEEVKTVVSHELGHWHRRDNLTALLHTFVEAVFWFFPPVKWIGARLIEERERACDEYVLTTGAAPRVYAEAILKVCKLYAPSPLNFMTGASGANLKMRIDAILVSRTPAALTPFQKVLLSGFGVLLLTVPFTVGMQTKHAWQNIPALDQVASAMAEQAAPQKQVAFNAASFDAFVGYYRVTDDPQRFVTISRRGGHFFFQGIGSAAVEIYPESGSKFFTRSLPGGRQVRFNTDIFGRTSSLTLYEGGFQLPPFQKISAATAGDLKRALEFRIANSIPFPNSQSILRRFIENTQKNTASYGEIRGPLATSAKQMEPILSGTINGLGALEDMRFAGVSPRGIDEYEVRFEHGRMLWGITLVDGKMSGLTLSEWPAAHP